MGAMRSLRPRRFALDLRDARSKEQGRTNGIMSSLGPETFKGSDEKAGPKKKAAKPTYDKDALIRRSKTLCEARTKACSGRGNQAHHVLRRSQGGSDRIDNLLWVCTGCHDWIHKHVAAAQAKGLLMKSGKK